jgi:hypothetical protein
MRWKLVLAVVMTAFLGLLVAASDATARGGGGGGGRGGGGFPGGGGRGPGGGGMGGPGQGFGAGGLGYGGSTGLGTSRFAKNRQSGNAAKEWELLKDSEGRKRLIQERRDQLMAAERRAQQEALQDQERLDAAEGR